MRILDTHLHLVYRDRFSYSWLVEQPKINRDWHVEDYFAEGVPLGVESALHMEVNADEPHMLAETAFVLGVSPRVIGAIANGRPEYADFPAYLDKLAALGRVRGVRRLLQGQPADLAEGATFLDNVRRLPGHGMVFDICLKSHELDVARKLIPACPDVQFVLDHCGNPKIAQGEWEPWASQVTAIARFPNVVCKVSGILANVDDKWTVAQLRPYVEHVIESFGWDRVVWGSDHMVVTVFASLTSWVNAAREIVSGASIEEQEKLFFRNAQRVYNVE